MNWDLILLITKLVLLLTIIFQDIKDRLVSVWIFPVLLIVVLFQHNSSLLELRNHLSVYGLNLFIIAIQFILVGLTYYLRKKGLNKLFNSIGGGDLLFFIILIVDFSTLHFLLFYTLALIFSMLLHSLLLILKPGNDKRIPLAGYMAVLLVITTISSSVLRIDPMSNYIMELWIG